MTRRGLALLLVPAAVLVPLPASAAPRAPAEAGCFDVVGADADYTAASGVVRVRPHLAAASCHRATYALEVRDASGTLGTAAVAGDGRTDSVELRVVVPVRPDGSSVGVTVTVSFQDRVADVAPDPVPLDATTDQDQDGLQDDGQLLDGAVPAFSGVR